jgi:hypothetical protein
MNSLIALFRIQGWPGEAEPPHREALQDSVSWTK